METAGNRRWWWLVLTLAPVPFIVLAVVHWGDGPLSTSGDYAQYMLHAKAILEGRAYGDLGVIQSPQAPFLGPRAYPPGLPLTIAPLMAIWGVNLDPLRVLMVVSVAVALVLSVLRLEPMVGRPTATLAGATVGVTLAANLAFSGPISDPGFMVATWGLLLLVDRGGRWNMLKALAIVALALAAMSYRIVGVTLVPALMLRAWLSPDVKERRTLGVVTLVLVCGGLLLLLLLGKSFNITPFVDDGIATLVRRIWKHSLHYPLIAQEAFLYAIPPGAINDVIHVAMSICCLIGGVSILWKHIRSLLVLWVICYLGLLLVAPVKDTRYLWPIYPLVSVAMFHGMRFLLERWLPPVRASRTAFAFGVLVLLGGTARLWRVAYPPTHAQSAASQELFDRVRKIGPAGRVVFYNPRVLILETEVASMSTGNRPPDETVAEFSEKAITHVVLGQLSGDSVDTKKLAAAISGYPGRFREEFRNRTYRLFRYVPPPEDSHITK